MTNQDAAAGVVLESRHLLGAFVSTLRAVSDGRVEILEAAGQTFDGPREVGENNDLLLLLGVHRIEQGGDGEVHRVVIVADQGLAVRIRLAELRGAAHDLQGRHPQLLC